MTMTMIENVKMIADGEWRSAGNRRNATQSTTDTIIQNEEEELEVKQQLHDLQSD
jgi:hypothetical protein